MPRFKRLPVGVVWKLGERGASSGVVFVTGPWFKSMRPVAKSPRVAEKCDIDIHSLTHLCAVASINSSSHGVFGQGLLCPNSVYATLGPEVQEQISRSGGHFVAKPPVLSSQASLVLIDPLKS
ncbi:hypothetical protein TNCV_2399351 [Trichonephila clavipes]|uniref:Uncharacterized protein n=1 Tax=Trichonephila clavipes TaxID=2585209 RepID=A0A8X6VR11_TRICX|nr:hypothetical protein TNCV_2399351 [Trichonephila clavipes]